VDSSTHRPQAALYDKVKNVIQMMGSVKNARATPLPMPENDAAIPLTTSAMPRMAVNPRLAPHHRESASLRHGKVNTPEKNVQRGGEGTVSRRISASLSKR